MAFGDVLPSGVVDQTPILTVQTVNDLPDPTKFVGLYLVISPLTLYHSNGTVWSAVASGVDWPTLEPILLANGYQKNAANGVAGLNADGNMQAVVVHRTGTLADLMSLVAPQGEIAMATDGVNAGQLVSVLAAGAKVVTGMQVASGIDTTTLFWSNSNTAKNIAVTGLGFAPKLVIVLAGDIGGSLGWSLSFIAGGAVDGICTALGMTVPASVRLDGAAIVVPVTADSFAVDDFTASLTSDGFLINNITPGTMVTSGVIVRWWAFA